MLTCPECGSELPDWLNNRARAWEMVEGTLATIAAQPEPQPEETNCPTCHTVITKLL